MRRIVAVLAALALLLVACGGSRTSTETTATEATASPTPTAELPTTTSTERPSTSATSAPALEAVEVTITTTHGESGDDEVFAVTGRAVDEGMVCAEGAVLFLGSFDAKTGDPIRGPELPETLLDEKQFICTDGSGEFVVQRTGRLLSDADWELARTGAVMGEGDTWQITSGTGNYTTMTGEGSHSWQQVGPYGYEHTYVGTVGLITTPTLVPAPTTTTTPLTPVTTGENIPEALSRDLIPWDEVGPGWYLVTFSAGDWEVLPESTAAGGPTILYLVDGRDGGVLYEVAAFEHGAAIKDWRLNGSAALVWERPEPSVWDHDLLLVDIATGDIQVLQGDHIEGSLGVPYSDDLRFTTPQGLHLVARTENWEQRPGIETLAYYDFAGNRLQELYNQPSAAGEPVYVQYGRLTWLYGAEGLDLLVSHRDGVAHIDNTGGLIRDLWVPEDSICQLVRWWTKDEALAYCEKTVPSWDGVPTHYRHLWLLDTDGTPGGPLIPEFGHYGPRDAWPTQSGLLLQGIPDSELDSFGIQLMAEGQSEPLPKVLPGNQTLVDVVDEVAAIHALPPSWSGYGLAFYTYDLHTGAAKMIIPPIEDVVGVTSVHGLATVYP